jgi:hypothetical protein
MGVTVAFFAIIFAKVLSAVNVLVALVIYLNACVVVWTQLIVQILVYFQHLVVFGLLIWHRHQCII